MDSAVEETINSPETDKTTQEGWEMLNKCLKEAQSALDKNRWLIQKVNENHQSKIPDNMVKNVALIQEINGNIAKVNRVYSNLSINFVNYVRQRRSDPNINANQLNLDDSS